MISKKQKFMLALQGYRYAGELKYWSVTEGELAGLFNDQYAMVTRYWGGEQNEYVIGEGSRFWYALGKRVTHGEMIKLWQDIPFKGWETKK